MSVRVSVVAVGVAGVTVRVGGVSHVVAMHLAMSHPVSARVSHMAPVAGVSVRVSSVTPVVAVGVSVCAGGGTPAAGGIEGFFKGEEGLVQFSIVSSCPLVFSFRFEVG